MTVRANKYTPRVMLSAPRRSAGIPNPDGSLVLYSVSTYSFDAHKYTRELRVLNPKTNESTLVAETGSSDVAWLDGGSVVVLMDGEKGQTKVVVGDVKDWAKR